MSSETHATAVGSWWTAGAGWMMTAWGWMTQDMPPLSVILAVLTIVLTAIKIGQEIAAIRRKEREDATMSKLYDWLTRKSGFGRDDHKDTRT